MNTTNPANPPGRPPSPAAAAPGDLQTYVRILVARKWVIAGILGAFLVGTLVFTLRQPRIYDATCSIIIDISAPKFLDDKQVQQIADPGAGGYWASREYFETELRVIESRAVALRVVDTLAPVPQQGEDPAAARERAAREALDAVRLEPVRESRVVKLIAEDQDPQRAAMLANTFADAYIAETLANRSITAENASHWLTMQLADLSGKLQQTGDRLFAFKKEHDILSTSWEDRQNMVSQRLVSINEALTKARIKTAEIEAKNEQLRDLGEALSGGTETEIVEQAAAIEGLEELVRRYYDIKSGCADEATRYLPDHPKLVACNERVKAIVEGLRDGARSVYTSSQRDLLEARRTETNLVRLLDETKHDSFHFNQYEREYSELKRSYDSNARLYEILLNRSKDAGLAGMLQMSNARILDRAQPRSTPVKPNLKRNFGIAFFLGLLAGIAVAFSLEFLDTSISTQDQIEEQLGLSMLGIIPEIDTKGTSKPELVVHAQPKSAVAECLRVIRTNVLFMSPERPLRTILITSSGPGEGKTMTSVTLAQAMAESGSRVLLVDSDMRRPRLHSVLGCDNSKGLSSVILDESSLEEACHPTEIANLSVLPCGPLPPNPAELLHTESFGRVLKRIAGSYDRMVFDSPPVGVVSDALVLSTLVDGTVLVLKAGVTSRDLARRVVRSLAGVNARLFGAILNEIDVTRGRYGYTYFQYGYTYGQQAEKPGELEPT